MSLELIGGRDVSWAATCAGGLFNYIDADGDGAVSYKEVSEEIKSFRASQTPASKLRGNAAYSDSPNQSKTTVAASFSNIF
jgi:hypothetical protein